MIFSIAQTFTAIFFSDENLPDAKLFEIIKSFFTKQSISSAINFRSLPALLPLPPSLELHLLPLLLSSLVEGLSTVVSLNLSHPDNPRMARQPRTKLNSRNRTRAPAPVNNFAAICHALLTCSQVCEKNNFYICACQR